VQTWLMDNNSANVVMDNNSANVVMDNNSANVVDGQQQCKRG